MIPFDKIDKSWTLFLDRDGVVNVEVVGDYITGGRLSFLKVLEALKIFAHRFGSIIMVTNQRGVVKG